MSFDVLAKLGISILLVQISLPISLLPASESILITADRIQTDSNKSSSDIRVITNEEIKNLSSLTLPELLSKESDLTVTNSGSNGTNASLFLRGTDSSHTLVLLDGIVMNDPSNPNRQFDIGRLSLNNIERIEILKGSQGLLYGSNAIGGVLVISTKKAQSNSLKGESYFDYGSFKTVNTGANFQKKILEHVGLSFGVDLMSTEGFSAADSKQNINADKDGSKRISCDLGSFLDLSKNTKLETSLRYSHSSTEVDKGGGAGSDDPNDYQIDEELYSKIQILKNWEGGDAQTKLSYNLTKHFRLFNVLYDSQHTEVSHTLNIGDLHTLSLNHTYYINEFLTQNFNIDFQNETDQANRLNQNISTFLYHQIELTKNIFNFGLRLDHNKYFDNHFTYKLAASHQFDSSLIKLSHSTGFRAPSLSQLFTPQYGNIYLTPETSQSVETSFEKQWANPLKSTSTVFFTKLNNRLSYNPNTLINSNKGNAEIYGVENLLAIKWSHPFTQNLSFTAMKTRDLSTNAKLPRRPDFNLKNIFTYQSQYGHLIGYEFSYVSKRGDVDNLGNNVLMSSYFISNINYRYILNSNKELYLKVKNLFNTDYQEIYGFGTGGISLTMGSHFYF